MTRAQLDRMVQSRASSSGPSRASLKALADARAAAFGLVAAGALLRLATDPFWPALLARTELVVRAGALAVHVAVLTMVPAGLLILARALGERGSILYAAAGGPHLMLGVLLFAFLDAATRRRLAAAGVTDVPVPTRMPTSPPSRRGD